MARKEDRSREARRDYRREDRDRSATRVDERISAARREIRDAVDRDKMLAAIRAAGARDADPEAIDAIAVLAEERMAEVIARAVESNREREEMRMRAGSVAVAAQREAEERRSARREFRRISV
jgi:hypothetical protein